MSYSLLLLAALAQPYTSAGGASNANPPVAYIEHAVVSLINDVQIPAQETGPLVAVHAKEGEQVKSGDLLAQIDDRQPQLEKYAAEKELTASRTQAADDIEVRFAQASHEVAAVELERSVELNRRQPGSVPTTEIRRMKLAEHRASLQIDKSKLDLEVAQMAAEIDEAKVKAADDAIVRRQVVSPIDGMVVAVFSQAGEWVNAGDPVLQVVRMDRLYVEGRLDGNEFDPHQVQGRPVTVETKLARGVRVQFTGKVVFVSPLVQAGNVYRVRVEVENRQTGGSWLLRPGMPATVAIQIQ